MEDDVFEDIGYRRKAEMMPGDRTYPQQVRCSVEKKEIKYTDRSPLRGQKRKLNAAIADDLIKRGFAEEIGKEKN